MNDHRGTRQSYDRVAGSYDTAIGGELEAKPLDWALLTALSERCSAGVVDIGCGPGHVGAHLLAAGCLVVGVDLSTAMCAASARRGLPAIAGDLVALPLADRSVDGVVCWYALIHLDHAERAVAYQEISRVLCPGGSRYRSCSRSRTGAAPCRARRPWRATVGGAGGPSLPEEEHLGTDGAVAGAEEAPERCHVAR